jgi:hypothetical protein
MKRCLHYNVLNYIFLRTLVYRGRARKLFWGGLKVLSKNRWYKIILFNKDRVWLQTSM